MKARRSIASNFFVAIHQKNLIVNVEKVKITNETLNEEKFDGDRKYYYNLYKTLDKPITITGKFGKFYLKISTGNEAMENRVAYINRKGMFVTSNKAFTKNPFTAQIDIGKYMAVVWAADNKTDERVRAMEPPTHESIEYGRIQEDDKRDETYSALKEISQKIKDEIKKKLNLDSSNETTNLTELADIVSFRDDVNQNKNGNDTKSSEPDKNIQVTKRTPTTTAPKAEVDATPDPNDDDNDNHGDKKRGWGTRPKKTRRVTSNMQHIRIIRLKNSLQIAYTSKTKAVRFQILPAGEEYKKEDPLQLTDVKNISTNIKSTKIIDNTIKIEANINSRVKIEVPIDESLSYTGYGIFEFEARSASK